MHAIQDSLVAVMMRRLSWVGRGACVVYLHARLRVFVFVTAHPVGNVITQRKKEGKRSPR